MPVKIKFFAVVMAVMCLMSCFCFTAFADETEVPSDWQYIQNGVSYVAPQSYTKVPESPMVLKVDPDATYTVTGLRYMSVIFGWDGTKWVKLYQGDKLEGEYTFTAEDYPGYEYLTFNGGSETVKFTVTVSWTVVSFLSKIIDNIGLWLTAALSWVGDVGTTVVATPLLLVFTVLPLVGLGVGLFVRLKS